MISSRATDGHFTPPTTCTREAGSIPAARSSGMFRKRGWQGTLLCSGAARRAELLESTVVLGAAKEAHLRVGHALACRQRTAVLAHEGACRAA